MLRNTRKHIVVTLFLLVWIGGGLYVVSKFFMRPEARFRVYPFLNDKTEYDVFFLGSSHVQHGISPMQLWHNYGITSYNLSVPACPLAGSYWILRNASEYHKPRCVVVDAYYMEHNRKGTLPIGFAHEFFDIFPLSSLKIESINDLYDSKEKRDELYVPFSLYHSRWRKIDFKENLLNLVKPEYTVDKGGEFKTDIKSQSKVTFFSKSEGLPANTLAMDYVRSIVVWCRENDIIPILVQIPFLATEEQQRAVNSSGNLAEELELPFYNMFESDIIDFDTDFFDIIEGNTHLNLSGGTKLTRFVGDVLHNEYHLPDHRGDSIYAAWDKDYKAYHQYLCGKIKEDIDDFRAVLMLSAASDFSVQIFMRDGIGLNHMEQGLINQLGSISVEKLPVETGYDIRLVVTDLFSNKVIADKRYGLLMQGL